MLILADVAAVILSMAVVGSWTFAAWVYAGGVLVSLAVSGAYRPRIALQLLNEAPALFQRSRSSSRPAAWGWLGCSPTPPSVAFGHVDG